MMLNKASTYLYTLGNDIYTGKNSSINIYLFIVNNSNTENVIHCVQTKQTEHSIIGLIDKEIQNRIY